MKHQFSVVRPTIDRPDLAIAKFGIVVAILLLGLRMVAEQVFLLVIPVAIGTGSALYLMSTRTQTTAMRPTLTRAVIGWFPAIVVFGLAGLVLSVHSLGARTDLVYLLTGAIGAAIFGQILFVETDRLSAGAILVQILAAAVVIRLSALYVTPGFVGVDIWTHTMEFTAGIASAGSLGALAESKYLMAPLYHTTAAIGTLVFGGVRNGLYLSLGLLVPLSALFVYATGMAMMPARWALLATALYAFSDQFIRWGMHIIPTSLGLVFFLASIYLVTRVFAAEAERWAVGLLLACSLAIVFTHQVSTAIWLFVLAIATGVGVVDHVACRRSAIGAKRGRRFGTGTHSAIAIVGVFVVTLVTTIVSWANTPFGGEGSAFLWEELSVIRAALTENAGFLNLASESAVPTTSVAEPTSMLGQLAPYVELVGFALLLAGTIVGGLGMLRWDVSRDITLTHLLAGGALFVATFGLSLFGLRVLLPGRWLAFLYVPMALIGAVGVYYVYQTGSYRVIAVVFLLLAIGYPTTMVVAEKATLDSPAFENQHKRFAYTPAEIGAVERLETIHPPESEQTIGTDHPYVSLFRRYGGHTSTTLTLGNAGPEAIETAVYRDYQSTGAASFLLGEGARAVTARNVDERVCPARWNKRYANDDVWYCTASGGSP